MIMGSRWFIPNGDKMPQSDETEITTDVEARLPKSDKLAWPARALATFLAASDESGLARGSNQALRSVLDRADSRTARPGDLGSRKFDEVDPRTMLKHA